MGRTIAVIEDDEFTRSMLVNALSSLGHVVAIDSPKPIDLLNHMKSSSVEAAILDLHLGKGPTGLDLAVTLRRFNPKIGIVILTSYEEPRFLRSNLPQLPRGTIYLQKGQIQNIQQLSDSVAQSIAGANSGQNKDPVANAPSAIANLSNSQLEIMRLMSQGLSNSEIAKRRFITEKAVEISLTRSAKALGIERDQTQNQRVHMAKTFFRAMGGSLDELD